MAAKLRHHVLWDSLCITVPPVVAAGYVVWLLFQTARLGDGATIISAVMIAVAGAYAIVRRYRPFVPTVSAVARMVDQQTGA
ncbi:MAG TPA: hypothetical protein VH985_04530, partial [Candidatus Binatia bacterium]